MKIAKIKYLFNLTSSDSGGVSSYIGGKQIIFLILPQSVKKSYKIFLCLELHYEENQAR